MLVFKEFYACLNEYEKVCKGLVMDVCDPGHQMSMADI